MQVASSIAVLVFIVAGTGAAQWNFEEDAVGEQPPGWKSAKTGVGPGSVWRVIEDATAPSGQRALAQVSSEGPNPLYNLCVAEQPAFGDVELSVRLKANSGKLDQGGGVVWRYRDADNYYVARANPLENNFRVYKVVRGKRQQLDSADVTFPSGKWVVLRVEQRGSHIECYLDGQRLLEADDSEFPGPGQIGLWTKADAATAFDDLKASAP